MNVTSELRKEHEFIVRFLTEIECSIEEKPIRLFNFFSSDIIDFITQFLDNFHHGKEENVLFRYLEKPSVLEHCNPLPVMVYEHNIGRELTLKMKDAVKNKEIELFCEYFREFKSLLLSHIMKEDNVLYHLAEDGLTDRDKEEILIEYRTVDLNCNKDELWRDYEEIYAKILDLNQTITV